MYVLKEKEVKGGTYTLNTELEGLEIKPRKGKEAEIVVKKVVILDKELCTRQIMKTLDKKITHLMNIIFAVLNSDAGEDDARIVLDEIAKIKSIIINKYRKLIKEASYKESMKALIIMEEEFKMNFMYKMSVQEFSRGRSR